MWLCVCAPSCLALKNAPVCSVYFQNARVTWDTGVLKEHTGAF